MPGKFYVYIHIKKSDGSVFYVGKGSGSRFNSIRDRNEHWKRVYRKHDFYAVKVATGMDQFCALSIESALISYIGIENLVNQKTGDLHGYTYTEEIRRKMSEKKRGWKPPPRSKETMEKLARSLRKPIISSNGEMFGSGVEAASWLRENGYPTASKGNISSCINGKMKTCYDRSWSLAVDGKPKLLKTEVSPKAKPVIRSDGKTFPSATHAAKWMSDNGYPNASQGTLSTACRGEKISAYGFSWRYLDEIKTLPE